MLYTDPSSGKKYARTDPSSMLTLTKYPGSDPAPTANNSVIMEITDNQYDSVSWNHNIEQNVKEIGEKSKGYKIMHIQEARKISQLYRRLMYAGIALGPLAGLLSGIGSMLYPSSAPAGFPIAGTCIAFISGIVVAITKYGKFEEKSSHHKIAASKYTGLESNVRRQLVLCRSDRVNAGQYLEYVGSNFDDLFLASPLVAKGIYDNYVIVAKKNGIVVPDEYGITIRVDEMYQENKLNELKNVSVINVNKSSKSVLEEEKVELKIEEPGKPLNSKTPSPESTQRRNIGEETFKGNKEIKRTGTLAHFPELNKYSDGRMEYEMQRMMGLK
uniref:Uncharacterized protein n=1 Tax=viral metagenome TaxID=1070528 RepID=A0A6C0JQ34_9ZZZZ